MGNSETEGFLRAEAEATELIEQLGKLKSETESYKEARRVVEEVMAVTREVGEALQGLSVAVSTMVREASAVGIPELIASEKDLAAKVEAQNEAASERGELLVSEISRVSDETRGDVRALAKKASDLGQELVEKTETLGGQVSQLMEEGENTKNFLERRLDDVEARIGTTRLLALINGVILVVGLGFVIVLGLNR